MDSRTRKIQQLRYQLAIARNFVREIAITCVELKSVEHLAKDYWGKKAILLLESIQS